MDLLMVIDPLEYLNLSQTVSHSAVEQLLFIGKGASGGCWCWWVASRCGQSQGRFGLLLDWSKRGSTIEY